MPTGYYARPSVEERFFKYTEMIPFHTCWEWNGAKNAYGYPVMVMNKRCRKASHISWELHNGPFDEGSHLCHKCDNPGCVNPLHLFLGDAKANCHDAIRKGRKAHNQNYNKTHCIHDHEFTKENTYFFFSKIKGLQRHCRTCRLEYKRRWRQGVVSKKT